jgi:capsular exopolysaccharide synthesis family protein
MELKDYIAPLLKWWWLIVAAAVVAAATAFGVTSQQPLIYQARTTLMIGNAIFEPDPNVNEFDASRVLAQAYADLVKRDRVRQQVLNALQLEVLPDYSARPLSNGLLEIAVLSTNPELAQKVADQLAEELIRQSPTNPKPEDVERQVFVEEQLTYLQEKIKETVAEISDKQQALTNMVSAQQITLAQEEIAALQLKLNSLQTNYSALLASSNQNALNTLSVFERASLPTEPISQNTLLIVILAAVAGAALAAGGAYLMEFLDDTIRTPEDVTRVLSFPIIGHIGEIERAKVGGLITVADQPRSSFAEAFRSLRTNLEFASVDKPLRTILVTSAGAGEGKTSVAFNLALIMAQGGKRVILVDGDLRRPNIHQVTAIPNRDGLSDLFRGHLKIDDVTRPWRDDRITVVTSGTPPPNPTELLSSKRMDQILFTLGEMADVVVVDGAPFFVPDAWVLASKVDGVLWVVRTGRTRRATVRSMREQIQRVNARIVGVVLNRMSRGRGYQGRYSYLSTYYYAPEEERVIGDRRRSLQSILRGLQKPAGKGRAGEAETALVPGSNGHGHRLEVLPPTPETSITKRSRVSLELLYAISRELANQMGMSELLQRILQMTLESVGASSGSIIVLDEKGEAMEGVMICDGKGQPQTAEQLKDIVERGLAGWVIENRRPVVLDNTHEDSRWLKREWDENGGPPRSAVSVPLMTNDRVVGVLTLVHPNVGHFTRDDLSMLTAIAVGISFSSSAHMN